MKEGILQNKKKNKKQMNCVLEDGKAILQRVVRWFDARLAGVLRTLLF